MDSRSEGSDRVLITGGGGFIGRHLVDRLLQRGLGVVTTFTDRPRDNLPPHIQQIMFSSDNVAALLRQVEMVVHLAARTGGIEFQRTKPIDLFFHNRGVTDCVLRAVAMASPRKLVVASSAAVYASSSSPLTEDSPTIAIAGTESAYAAAKLVDEMTTEFVRRSGPTLAVIARLGNVYGGGGRFDAERSSVIHSLIRRSIDARSSGRLIAWGSPETVRSFVYVDDAAEAIARLVTTDPTDQVFNVDSGQPVTIGQVANLIAGLSAPGSTVEFDQARPHGDPYRVLSIDRLKRLGFRPAVDLEEGIQRTLHDFATDRVG